MLHMCGFSSAPCQKNARPSESSGGHGRTIGVANIFFVDHIDFCFEAYFDGEHFVELYSDGKKKQEDYFEKGDNGFLVAHIDEKTYDTMVPNSSYAWI